MPPTQTPRQTSTTTNQSSPHPTTDWKTYRNEKYGFELRYPPDWFIEEGGPDLTENIIALIRTKKFREEKLSECCPYAMQEPGDEDKTVRIYEGQIGISFDSEAFFNQQCHLAEKEVLELSSGSWTACIFKPEGFSIPYLSIGSLTPGYMITLRGGLESERSEADVMLVSQYNFFILQITSTFKFTR